MTFTASFFGTTVPPSRNLSKWLEPDRSRRGSKDDCLQYLIPIRSIKLLGCFRMQKLKTRSIMLWQMDDMSPSVLDVHMLRGSNIDVDYYFVLAKIRTRLYTAKYANNYKEGSTLRSYEHNRKPNGFQLDLHFCSLRALISNSIQKNCAFQTAYIQLQAKLLVFGKFE